MRKGLGYNRSVSFNNIVPTKVCEQCGKEFCLPVGANFDEYVYKEFKGRNYKFFCSWSCLQAYRRKKAGGTREKGVLEYDDGRRHYQWSEKRRAAAMERQKKQLDLIMPLHESGLSSVEIKLRTGIAVSTINLRLREFGKRGISREGT